jgi:hypothetical protein
MIIRKCPSKAEIIRYLETEGAGKGRPWGLLEHIAKCPRCRIVLEASLEVASRANGILKDLEGLELGDPQTVERLRGQARREIRLLQNKGRRGYRRWLAVPVAGAVLVLVVALLLVPGRPPGAKGGMERGSLISEIGLLRPKGTVPYRQLKFQWTRNPGILSCRLEIYDQVLNPIYQSAVLAQDSYALPVSALDSLHRGVTYFWKVIGTLKNGRILESEFASFVLRE